VITCYKFFRLYKFSGVIAVVDPVMEGLKLTQFYGCVVVSVVEGSRWETLRKTTTTRYRSWTEVCKALEFQPFLVSQ
jgi:hypothetical protein